jgi:SAM-dependent methyltransferase
MFADWKAEVLRQGETLDGLIRKHAGPSASTVLDCACGIGTQAIGLAMRGYKVMATDLSPGAIERASKEAINFGVSLSFGVADFRTLDQTIADIFDVVICCDNSLSHVIEDKDLLAATWQMKSRLKPGGLFLASIRDYDRLLDPASNQTQAADPGLPGLVGKKPSERPRGTMPQVFDDADGRRIAFQVWDWTADGRSYAIHQFFLQQLDSGYQTAHHVSRFRALRRYELTAILMSAGFSEIEWRMPLKSGFYQPVVLARNN